MASERSRQGFVSIDEFLAFENASPTRHEYVAGRVYATSGTTARHNDTASNIHARLRRSVPDRRSDVATHTAHRPWRKDGRVPRSAVAARPLIAEHDRRRATLYSRADAGDWTRTELFASGQLELPCPRSTLSLDEIYDGVELPPLRVSEEPDDEDTWVDPIQFTSLVEGR